MFWLQMEDGVAAPALHLQLERLHDAIGGIGSGRDRAGASLLATVGAGEASPV